jgi:hypothetical protein
MQTILFELVKLTNLVHMRKLIEVIAHVYDNTNGMGIEAFSLQVE